MKLPRRFWTIAAAVIIALALFGNSGFRRLIRRYFDIRNMKSRLEYLKRENILLKKEINLLENDQAYLERIARRELGLVSNGEYEYRFKKEVASEKK